MKTPPNRQAALVLILLVLAGAGGWWWWHDAAERSVAAVARTSDAEPGSARSEPVGSGSAKSVDPVADPCNRAIMAAFNSRAGELRGRQDAASQLAYALAVPIDPKGRQATPKELELMMLERQAEARRALLRAAELAPKNPEVLWLAATQCGNEQACRGVQAALLAAEPDNMAVWQWEMAWAHMRNDPEGVARAFDAAAGATRVDLHVGAVHEAMLDAYGDIALPDACKTAAARAAMRAATGIDRDLDVVDTALMIANIHESIPTFSVLRNNCAPAAVEAGGKKRRANCIVILDRMSGARTLIERAVALDGMVQLSVGSSDAGHWRERYREHRWLMEQLADPRVQALLQPEDHSLDEANSIQTALEDSGRWPPPANWLPEDERARSLILTGQPPESRR